jgi:hypothetical protein
MDETPLGLRAEIAHLQHLAEGVTDQQVKDGIAKMIEELEQRLRDLGENRAAPVLDSPGEIRLRLMAITPRRAEP